MIFKVLIYACATGVFFSRKIAREAAQGRGVWMLDAGNFSQHRTICDFRADHLQALAALLGYRRS